MSPQQMPLNYRMACLLSSLVLNLDTMVMLQLQGRKIDVRKCVLSVVYVKVHLELLTIHAFHSYLSSSNQRLVVRGHR